MLEVKFITENTDLVKRDLKKRNQLDKILLVDQVVHKYNEFLEFKKQLDFLRHKRNVISEDINKLKKQNIDVTRKIKEAKDLPKEIQELEQNIKVVQENYIQKLKLIPNIMHKSVPIGKDASGNKVIKKWGKIPKFKFELKSHGELIEKLNQADFKKATEVSGAGFVYLKDKLALLDLALQRFAIDFLLSKKFMLIYPPFMLRKKATEGATDLEAFKDMIYKIENEDLYLIPTSEFPVVSMFTDRILNELPVKCVGYSTCFRKEIGSHGVDTRGFHRMHQFNKVEQVILCNQEDSYKHFDEMQKYSEELMQKLKLPYRVVAICSGDLGAKQAKQYDIEAYFPREEKYEEVTSCSNCTSYQSVSLNIKYIDKKGNKKYVHMLNNTALATSRVMRSILENYQQKDGSIKIPTVLQKYMNGIKIIK